MATPRISTKKAAHYEFETLMGMCHEVRTQALFWVAFTEGFYETAKASIAKINPFHQTIPSYFAGRNDHLIKIPSNLSKDEIQKLVDDYPDYLAELVWKNFDEKKFSPLTSRIIDPLFSSHRFRDNLESNSLFRYSFHHYANDPNCHKDNFVSKPEAILFAGIKHAISNDEMDKTFGIIHLLKKNIRRFWLDARINPHAIQCREEELASVAFLNKSILHAWKEKRFDIAHRILNECDTRLQQFCFLNKKDRKINLERLQIHLALGYVLKDLTEESIKEYANKTYSKEFISQYAGYLIKDFEPLLAYNRYLEKNQDSDLKTFERWRLKEITFQKLTKEKISNLLNKLADIHPKLPSYFGMTIQRLEEENNFSMTLAEFVPVPGIPEIVLEYTALDYSSCQLEIQPKGLEETKADKADKKCENDSSTFLSDLRKNLADIHFPTSTFGRIFSMTDDVNARKANKLIESLPMDLTQKENQIFVLKVALVLLNLKSFDFKKLMPVELEWFISIEKETILLDLANKFKAQLRSLGLKEIEIDEISLQSLSKEHEIRRSNPALAKS